MGKKSFLSLVILLVTIMMSTRGCKAKKLSSMMSGCSGYECLILDVDLEFLLDSEVSMRILQSQNMTAPKPVTGPALGTGSAVHCDRLNYGSCLPNESGQVNSTCKPNERCRPNTPKEPS